jgi:hypothetical protein
LKVVRAAADTQERTKTLRVAKKKKMSVETKRRVQNLDGATARMSVIERKKKMVEEPLTIEKKKTVSREEEPEWPIGRRTATVVVRLDGIEVSGNAAILPGTHYFQYVFKPMRWSKEKRDLEPTEVRNAYVRYGTGRGSHITVERDPDTGVIIGGAVQCAWTHLPLAGQRHVAAALQQPGNDALNEMMFNFTEGVEDEKEGKCVFHFGAGDCRSETCAAR